MAKNRRANSDTEVDAVEHARVKALDEYLEFSRYFKHIEPILKKALEEGKPAEEIYRECQHLVALRAVTLALTEQDTSKAMSAIKDVLDRGTGKAKERIDHTHRYKDVSDDQLDAMIKSMKADITGDKGEGDDFH
ncbi:MAG: hypothetical protein ACTSV7_08800 [Candidatus Baldrarchaeia archaeon]